MVVRDLIEKLQGQDLDSKVFMEGQTHYSEASEVEEAVIGLLEGVVIRFND